MTDDLRARIECALGLHPVIRDRQTVPLADAVMKIVQPIADELTEAEIERDTLRLQLRDAEAQQDPAVVNEMTGSYLVGRQVASAALYNTVLRRAMKAEAERDGRREVERSQAEAAVQRVREWLDQWGPRLPDGACSTLDQALAGNDEA